MKSIKYKIIVYFCTTVIGITLVTGAIISWRLNQSIAKQSTMLSSDVRDHTFHTLDGHNKILSSFVEDIKEDNFKDAKELSQSPIVKTILENEMFYALADLLQSHFKVADTSFALILSPKNKLLASYPNTVDKSWIEKHFVSNEIEKKINSLLHSIVGDLTQKIALVFQADMDFLKACGFGDRGVAPKGGIGIISATIITDDFGNELGAVITGTLLNGHNKYLTQLYEATDSTSAFYHETNPIASAGFISATQNDLKGGSIKITPETLIQIYNSPDHGSVNIVHQLASEQYLSTCSPIISFTNEKLGAICVNLAESKIIKAQQYGHDTKKNIQIWILGIGFASLIIFVLISLFIAKSLIVPLQNLIGIMKRAKDGDFDIRADVRGKDEMRDLAKGFNEMLGQIQEREKELQQHRNHLEDLVGQRTSEIEKANLQLQFELVERKKVEKALVAFTEKLKKSNQELQDFAYIASHDLQEPLRKVQVFGDRLKTKYADALEDRGRDYLERMQNASGRMQVLINDLLSYSRVTTKAQPFIPVNLTTIAQEVVSDLEIRIEQAKGRVELDILPTIEADPIQIRQLLQNLIGNALKFCMKDKPPIVKVYSRFIDDHLSVTESISVIGGRSCELIVEDNGIGFEEKYAQRIFGFFQRLHGRSDYEGSGVGLTICRKIAERHGGSIIAKSAPGKGAKFIVTLPVKQKQGEDDGEQERKGNDSHG